MDKGFFGDSTEIEKEYLSSTPTSWQHDVEACCYLQGGNTRSDTDSHPYPVYMDGAEGCYLMDVDGNRYIEDMNNYTVLILGHAHPKFSTAHRQRTNMSWDESSASGLRQWTRSGFVLQAPKPSCVPSVLRVRSLEETRC